MGGERGSWAGGGAGGWQDVDDEPYDSGGGGGSDVSKLFFWLRPEETRRLLGSMVRPSVSTCTSCTP